MARESGYEIALRTFERLREAFPALEMTLVREPEYVDLEMEIPAQPGLDFEVHLDLQNVDELHVVAGALWVEWFPCTQPGVADLFFEAVSGLLSGRFRIVEHRRGSRPVKAELQRPAGETWETLATWSTFSWPWPRKISTVLRNRAAA